MRKFLLLTTGLCLIAADPASAGPVAGAIAAIGAVIKGSAILSAVAQIGLSMALSAVARKLGPKPQAAKASVSLEVQTGDVLPLSFPVGRYATAGKRKHIASWGKNTRFITEVLEVSALPCPGFHEVWLGDEKATVYRDRRGFVTGVSAGAVEDVQEGAAGSTTGFTLGHPMTTPSMQGKRLAWIHWYDGTQTSGDPLLAWATSTQAYPWSGYGKGKSYAIITYQYDKDVLTNLPAAVIEPHGTPMYDPRKDGSTGGTGAHRWGNWSTYETTDNPMVIAYNIIRGIYYGSEWVYGGKNLPASRLPRAWWVAAMNACDRAVPVSGGGTEPAYRIGYEIEVDTPAADVLEQIGSCSNARFSEVGGRIKPCVELPASAVMTIHDSDVLITEGQSFNPFYPMADTFNSIGATYPEPREKWVSKDAPERIFTDELTADGGRYLPTSVNFAACPFATQVQRLMVSQMKEFRRMRQHSITLPPGAYMLEPMDMISWTSELNGYEEKKFVVEEVSNTPGMLVPVALREVDPEDYDWSPAQELPVEIITPVKPIPVPQGITGVTALPVLITDNEGKGRKAGIQVSAADGEVGVTDIRIQVERGGATLFDVTRPYSAPYVWTLTGVAPMTTYRVRAALVSEFTNTFEWSPWISLTTLEEQIWTEQLSDEIISEFERLAAEGGIKIVDSLPLAGDTPDQVVMLRSNKRFYRWDAPTGLWSTEVYSGVADGSITSAKIVAGQIISSHIASSAVLATHIAAGQVTADKINVDELSAVSAEVGLLRTASSGQRLEIHNDMILVYDSSGTIRVRIGRLV